MAEGGSGINSTAMALHGVMSGIRRALIVKSICDGEHPRNSQPSAYKRGPDSTGMHHSGQISVISELLIELEEVHSATSIAGNDPVSANASAERTAEFSGHQ